MVTKALSHVATQILYFVIAVAVISHYITPYVEISAFKGAEKKKIV